MTLEQSFFLNILRDYLTGIDTQWLDELDKNAVFELAKKHQMLGIAYLQLKNSIKERPDCRQLYALLQRGYLATQFYYENRKRAFDEVCSLFRGQGIRFFVVKGFPVAALYPTPEMRTMGDVDMVLSPTDREKAHMILSEQGFENRVHADKEWTYYKNEIEFELHTRLIYPQIISDDKQLAFSDRMWNYVREGEETNECRLDWSYHFVFLLLHLRKHFLNQGVGLRLFLDLAVVIRAKAEEINWQWVQTQMDDMQLEKFSERCFAFCEKCFGVSSPIAVKAVDESLFEQSVQKIFADGIFGYYNEANKKNFVGNEIRAGESYTAKMFKNFRKWFFPSYRTMIGSEQYAFLKGKPFLLPFAWIYRLIYVRKNKREYSGEVLKESFSSKKEIDKRNDLLDKWGL